MPESSGPPNKQRVVDFILRLQDEMFEVDGKQALRPEAVTALIEEDPDLAAAAVMGMLHAGDLQPGIRQLALTVAVLYEHLTGDDSLTRRARRELQEAGQTPPQFVAEPEAGSPPEASGAQEPPRGVRLHMDRATLASGDVYNFVRLFKVEHQDAEGMERLRALRGRCLLTFDLDEDPRSVWEVPEARTLVHKLFEAMPYFPYFLDLRPVAGSFMLFFGCLADPDEAFVAADPEMRLGDIGNDWRGLEQTLEERRELRRRQGLPELPATTVTYIDPLHPSVVEPVASSAVAIAQLCRLFGEAPRPVLQDLLVPYPEEVRDDILAHIDTSFG